MKNHIKTFIAIAGIAFTSSCIKITSDAPNSSSGNYIITVTPAAMTGVADYILTAPSLDTGAISNAKTGLEQDGTYRYYVTANNRFFSLLYGQGNPGAVTTYEMQNGKLTKLSNFQSETVQAFAPADSSLVLFKISRNINSPQSKWFKVSTRRLLITSEGTVDTKAMTGNGELAHFSWLKQVGNKLFAPYFTIAGSNFSTNYPDSTFVAVFNIADMKFEKVIRDGRTGPIGRYFRDGLAVTENGDVYGFSSTVGMTNGALSAKKPSAIVRIKAGTTEFDKSYFFNFEQVSGGMNITNWQYLGNNLFIVAASTRAEKGPYLDGLHYGVVDVSEKTFKPITGMPSAELIKSVTYNNYMPGDGRTGYVGVNLKDGTGYIYRIDAFTLTATKGLKVTGGLISAIQHLN